MDNLSLAMWLLEKASRLPRLSRVPLLLYFTVQFAVESVSSFDWNSQSAKPMLRQKDIDACWTKKNNENHYGYKNHINADQDHKLVQSYQVADAAVHDSQVFEVLLDLAEGEDGKKRSVYADSAYRSKEKEDQLTAANIPSQICEKGSRSHPLTDEQKAANKIKSKVACARRTCLWRASSPMVCTLCAPLACLRAQVKIGMLNLVYNMVRLGQLLKRDRRNAPAVA